MFNVGDVVRHKEYGRGIIKYVVLAEEDVMPYFVEFDNKHEDLHRGGWRGYYGKEGSCLWLSGVVLYKVIRFKGNKHATAS